MKDEYNGWYKLPFHEGQWIYKFRVRHNRLAVVKSYPSLRMSSLLCLWITSSDNSNWWFPLLDLSHLSNEELLLMIQLLQPPIVPTNDRLEIWTVNIWNWFIAKKKFTYTQLKIYTYFYITIFRTFLCVCIMYIYT